MRVLRLVGAAAAIAGCGGGSGNGGPGPQVQVARVDVVPSANATSICGNVTLTATPRDAQNNPLTRDVSWNVNQSILALSSTTTATATGTGVGIGTTDVTATSGGITSPPTVSISVTGGPAPATRTVEATVGNTFSPTCVDVQVGGTVTWSFAAQHNVIWDAAEPPGGDIPPTSSGTVSRTFPTAGNYPYDCNLHGGMRGRIIVR